MNSLILLKSKISRICLKESLLLAGLEVTFGSLKLVSSLQVMCCNGVNSFEESDEICLFWMGGKRLLYSSAGVRAGLSLGRKGNKFLIDVFGNLLVTFGVI